MGFKSCLILFLINQLLDSKFSQLLDISHKNFLFIFSCIEVYLYWSIFLDIEVWFAYQTFKPLKIEDKIKITLVIN